MTTETKKFKCPNGCDPDLMEREDYGGGIPPSSDDDHKPNAEYNCGGCGWNAIWRKGERLQVLNPVRTLNAQTSLQDAVFSGELTPQEMEWAEA